MADILQNEKYAVERAVIDDVVKHENARILFCDGKGAAVRLGDLTKCVFADISDFAVYADKYGLYGDVCLLGAPKNAPCVLGFDGGTPCVTFAYLEIMPPPVETPYGTDIKRLAPSLAGTVAEAYSNPCGGYTADSIAVLMRDKGVFGAITDGRLSGFIGRHGDGNMGMLEVFPEFRRRGIATALERFMINYIMTFGRTPVCDVYADNAASFDLQCKLGLTPAKGYTFWCEIQKKDGRS